MSLGRQPEKKSSSTDSTCSSQGQFKRPEAVKRGHGPDTERPRQTIFTTNDNREEGDVIECHEEEEEEEEEEKPEPLDKAGQLEVASGRRTGSSGAHRKELGKLASNRSPTASLRPKDEKRASPEELEEGRVNVSVHSKPNSILREEIGKQAKKKGKERKRKGSSFVLDPSGVWYHRWSMVVSLAFLYNFWSLSYRFAFREIDMNTYAFWFALDYSADFIYGLDIFINFHTGYLEDGVLQRDIDKIRHHYYECTSFYLDTFCLLPLDMLYITFGFNSILRCTRLVKIYKFWSYVDRTERHTNYPNVFRTFTLVHYILVIFHWNACLFHMISKNKILDVESLYKINDNQCDDILCQYLHAFYWSTLALTTIGDLPRPRTKGEYVYITFELFFGLFLFASVLGHVANIVTNVSAARKEFQAKLDAVKTFMRMRRVSDELQTKVIRWFDYLWISQKSSDEDKSVGCLPDRLKAEIAIHVHLDTLKRVDIFQNTEAGFLCELVLRLKPVLFSPGDYVCRKNEVGHEMYIVSRGILEVVADGGKLVVATLKAGSYFGEISVLNVGLAGNKRTASVRSVGYSDLFCLNKQDLWDVLKNYPNAESRIRARAEERLSKLDINKQASTSNKRAELLTATSGRRGKQLQMSSSRQLTHSYSSNCRLAPRGLPTNKRYRHLIEDEVEEPHRLWRRAGPAEPEASQAADEEAEEEEEKEEEEELIYNWSGHKSSVGGGRPNCRPNPSQLANNGNKQPSARGDNNKYHRSPGPNHSSSLEGPPPPQHHHHHQEPYYCSNRTFLQVQNKRSPRRPDQPAPDFCWPNCAAQTGNGEPASSTVNGSRKGDNAARRAASLRLASARGRRGPASPRSLVQEMEDGAAGDFSSPYNSDGSSDCYQTSNNYPSPSSASGLRCSRPAASGRWSHLHHHQLYQKQLQPPSSSYCHHLTRTSSSRSATGRPQPEAVAGLPVPTAYWLPVSPLNQQGFFQLPAATTIQAKEPPQASPYGLLQPIIAGEPYQSVSMGQLNPSPVNLVESGKDERGHSVRDLETKMPKDQLQSWTSKRDEPENISTSQTQTDSTPASTPARILPVASLPKETQEEGDEQEQSLAIKKEQ